MTPPTLDELMKLAEAATPGPWKNEDHRDRGDWKSTGLLWAGGDECRLGVPVCQVECGKLYAGSPKENIEQFEDTAAFIAAANPDTVLKILRDYKRMREALEKIKDGGVDIGVPANVHERMLVMCEISTDCLDELEMGKGEK